MSESLVFYTNPMSRGQIIRWMLEEVAVDYRENILEYGDQMVSPEYLAINPMGKVPAIKHGDKVVTECAAICAYLADAFPEAELSPTIAERADYYRWMFFAAGPLESAVTNKSLGFNTDEQQERMAGYGNYDRVISVLDEVLAQRKYICGEKFTAADVYLGSQIDFGLIFGSIESTDNFARYVSDLRSRSAYKNAKQKDQALIDATS